MTSNIRCNSCCSTANDVRTQFHFLNVLQSAAREKHCKLKRKFLRFKNFFVIFCWTHTYTPKLRHVTADYFPVLIGRLRDNFSIIAFFTQFFFYNCTHRFLHFLVITSFCWLILIRGNNLGLKLLQHLHLLLVLRTHMHRCPALETLGCHFCYQACDDTTG